MYFIRKTIHFEVGRFQNPITQCVSGFWGAPRGPLRGQGVCTITVLVPRGLHDNVIVSKRFPHPWRDPPRKPHIAQNHIFPTFFHHFCFALWAQRAPPRPPLLARAPPLGPSEAPPRIATAPLGPQRAPLAAENAPKSVRVPPNSGQLSQNHVLSHVPSNIDTILVKVAVVPVGSIVQMLKKGT